MAGLPKYVRTIFIVGAGIGAFFAAERWSREQSAKPWEIAEAVTPAGRISTVPGASASASSVASAVERDASLSVANRDRSIPSAVGDLFASLNWAPPPPPPAPAAPPAPPPRPAAPVTPPLPFTFVGMLERGAARPEAFLAKGEALLVVSAGDLLDNNTYRVDTLTANEIVMTYLPLNIQQTLSVPGATR